MAWLAIACVLLLPTQNNLPLSHFANCNPTHPLFLTTTKECQQESTGTPRGGWDQNRPTGEQPGLQSAHYYLLGLLPPARRSHDRTECNHYRTKQNQCSIVVWIVFYFLSHSSVFRYLFHSLHRAFSYKHMSIGPCQTGSLVERVISNSECLPCAFLVI